MRSPFPFRTTSPNRPRCPFCRALPISVTASSRLPGLDPSHARSSMGALAAPPPPDLPPWLALVAPLFGGGKENEAPEEEARAPPAEVDVVDDVPWWRPLFWSPTTGLEAHEALQAALPLIGCVPASCEPARGVVRAGYGARSTSAGVLRSSNTLGMLKTALELRAPAAARMQRTSALRASRWLPGTGAHGARAAARCCTHGRGRWRRACLRAVACARLLACPLASLLTR